MGSAMRFGALVVTFDDETLQFFVQNQPGLVTEMCRPLHAARLYCEQLQFISCICRRCNIVGP